MAMINCPECGKEISDKAKTCIHCGRVLIEEEITEETIKCEECGAVLFKTDEVCPNCGCPIEPKSAYTDNMPQQVEVTNIKMAKRTKKVILGIVIAIVICAAGGIGYKVYLDNKAEQEYNAAYNEYIDNLDQIKILMISGGSDAESLCNLTLRVWGNAIYKESDPETDKYTKEGFNYVSDFNDALLKLYTDSETISKMDSIEKNQSSVKDLIKKLQNPPVELEKCYDTVSDLYEAYKILTDLALSPSGNYSGYSENKSDAVSDFMSAFEKLDTQIPEKIKTE